VSAAVDELRERLLAVVAELREHAQEPGVDPGVRERLRVLEGRVAALESARESAVRVPST
jgi:hypothetical protein